MIISTRNTDAEINASLVNELLDCPCVLLAADNKLSDYLLPLKVLLEPMVEPMITIPS